MTKIVMKFDDELLTANTVADAETMLTKLLPEMPGEVYEEDEACEMLREFDPLIREGDVVLVEF